MCRNQDGGGNRWRRSKSRSRSFLVGGAAYRRLGDQLIRVVNELSKATERRHPRNQGIDNNNNNNNKLLVR
jgi:hypothetical protein